MKRQYSIDMTTGSISRKIFQFALPLMVSLLLQQLYNAADKTMVGRFAENGDIALAAVGATGAPSSLMLNLVVGLSTGSGIICSNLLGGRQMSELRRNMHTAVSMGLVSGILLAAVGVLLARPFMELMSCPENVMDMAVLYMRIFFLGMPATMVYNFGSGILRTYGDSRRPMVILGVSGLINVVFNMLFVMGFKMSVAGVAWATVIAQTVSAVWVLWILFNPKDAYKMSFRELNLFKNEVLTIIKVGLPCGLNSAMFNIANVVLQSTTNGFGDMAVAGVAAADSITNIYHQIVVAFYTAAMTFIGQCYGAGKIRRIRKILLRTSLYCVGCITAVSIASTIFSEELISVFNTTPAVIKAGAEKLIVTCVGYMVLAFGDVLICSLRGMRRTVIPTVINVMCVFVFRMVWVAWIYPLCEEIWFLYLSYFASYILSLAFMLPYYIYTIKKLQKEHPEDL